MASYSLLFLSVAGKYLYCIYVISIAVYKTGKFYSKATHDSEIEDPQIQILTAHNNQSMTGHLYNLNTKQK